MLTHTPESFTCLSASLSEKDDMSVAGLLADCSKLLKGTLRVYTTSSDSSGLSLDTPGWDDTYIKKKKNNHINNVKKKKKKTPTNDLMRATTARIKVIWWCCLYLLLLFLSPGFAFAAPAGLLIWGAEVWRAGRALLHHALLLPLHQDFHLEILRAQLSLLSFFSDYH